MMGKRIGRENLCNCTGCSTKNLANKDGRIFCSLRRHQVFSRISCALILVIVERSCLSSVTRWLI